MKKLTTYFELIALSFIFIITVSAQNVPPAPANLTAEQQGANAKLTWNSSQGASSYRIYRSVDSSPFILLTIIHPLNYTDSDVSTNKVYRYYVTAINYIGESLPSNDVTFTLDMTPPSSFKGYINGNIMEDSTNQPIGGVRLRFYKPDGFLYFREARTDSLGYYSIHIDTGSYYIYASKWTYQSEWYDNVADRENANLVSVISKDTNPANFGLKRIVPLLPPRLVSVSGAVTDSVSGSPIKDAFVVIMRSTRQINLIQNQEGNLFGNRNETFMIPGFGTLVGVMRVVRTGEDGSYTAWVPDSLNYIMLAFKLGYLPEFYNNKFTPYDADHIFPTSNISGINFDLTANPNAQNSVGGQVKGLDGEGVFSKVVLFQKTTIGVFPLRCAVTDTNGNYSFNYLFSGHYYTKAYPFSSYAPAWFSTDSCGIACWVHADSFLVDGNTTGIDICVQPIAISGFASIRGNVIESASGAEIQGATVYAVSTVSNRVVGYDITEKDGIFDIQNLPPDTYQVVVDKEGYAINLYSIYTVDAVNNFIVTGAVLSLSSVTLGVPDEDNGIATQYKLNQNYPNPFNPETEIIFGVPTESYINISVYNVLGQQVAVLFDKSVNAGSYSVKWNGSDFSGRLMSSGIYFYRITAHSENSRIQFTDMKKMILVK